MKLFRRKHRPHVRFVDLRSQPRMNTDLLMHRFLLDSRLTETQQLATILGLSPLDDEEGAEEDAAASERARRMSPIAPLISLLSSVLSVAVVEYLQTTTDEAFPEEIADYLVGILSRISLSTSLGTVARLEDLGLIVYTYERA